MSEPVGGVCRGCGEAIEPHLATCPTCGRDLGSVASTTSTIITPQVGTAPQLNDFDIIRTLGRGGMGTVHEAYQRSMHRRVALKVLGAQPSLAGAERFEREAWIGGRLAHPYIVKVYEQGVENDVAYLVMELVEGESLHVALQQLRRSLGSDGSSSSEDRRAHIRRMVSLFIGVVDALEYAHRHGVVHRDIKPHNLLLGPDDRLFLSDFGLARDEAQSGLTRRGDFMGTIRYMSPEQLLAHRTVIDHRTDLWSMGVSLYEAVTLDLPFAGDTDEAYIGSVSMREPVPARVRNTAITRDLETVLLKCLERDPDRRYASAALLRDDLQRCLDDRPVLARRPGVLLRSARFVKRHRVAVVLAILVVVGVLGLIVAQTKARADLRDRYQIESTLERLATTPTRPQDVQPDWDRLSSLLQGLVQRDPRSDLAQRAYLAACAVRDPTAQHVRTRHRVFDAPDHGRAVVRPGHAHTLHRRCAVVLGRPAVDTTVERATHERCWNSPCLGAGVKADAWPPPIGVQSKQTRR